MLTKGRNVKVLAFGAVGWFQKKYSYSDVKAI